MDKHFFKWNLQIKKKKEIYISWSLENTNTI